MIMMATRAAIGIIFTQSPSITIMNRRNTPAIRPPASELTHDTPVSLQNSSRVDLDVLRPHEENACTSKTEGKCSFSPQ
jgi:hypothetical protein